jgi:plasmid stabilization system protein ParE
MVRLNWTLESSENLKNIYDFIAQDSKHYAKIHINRIKEKANLLTENPKIGRIVPEIYKENIREIIFGNYRIIYRIVIIDRIDILTIHHSARILKIQSGIFQ